MASRKRTYSATGMRQVGRPRAGPNSDYGSPANRVKRQRTAQRRRRSSRAFQNVQTGGFLGVEKKFYDTSLTAGPILAPTACAGCEYDPSTTSMISTPVQGDGEQNRDGKRIACSTVHIEGVINWPGDATDTDVASGSTVYVALVLDTQSNGAQMNSEDCFKNTSASAALAATPQRNLLFGPRFTVLKKKVFSFIPPGTWKNGANDFITPGKNQTFSWHVPLNGLVINFNAGTTASIANVIDNSLHMIAFSNNIVQAPTLSYNARLRFVG